MKRYQIWAYITLKATYPTPHLQCCITITGEIYTHGKSWGILQQKCIVVCIKMSLTLIKYHFIHSITQSWHHWKGGWGTGEVCVCVCVCVCVGGGLQIVGNSCFEKVYRHLPSVQNILTRIVDFYSSHLRCNIQRFYTCVLYYVTCTCSTWIGALHMNVFKRV